MARSSSTGTPIRCPCGNTLGTLLAGLLYLKHRGREVVSPLPHSIRCEKCGRTWTPQQQGSSAA